MARIIRLITNAMPAMEMAARNFFLSSSSVKFIK
nr:MAG TPA: hypothetical protein [Caudoviricetes sp.]